MNKNFAISLLFLFGSAALSAQVKLLPIFSDNMVLQQKTQAPVWGETQPNKTVEITTSWDKKKYTVQADAQGKWKTKVETPVAGGPYTMTISDGKPVKLNNVMIGEVWVCSGQSNMEMQVEGWGKVKNYEQEKEEAKNLIDAFKEALTLGKPMVLDCHIELDDKVWPMVNPGGSIEDAFDKADLEAQAR